MVVGQEPLIRGADRLRVDVAGVDGNSLPGRLESYASTAHGVSLVRDGGQVTGAWMYARDLCAFLRVQTAEHKQVTGLTAYFARDYVHAARAINKVVPTPLDLSLIETICLQE